MFEFLTAGPNIIFAVMLVLLLVFFLAELSSLVFGASLSGMLGDVDLPLGEMDADIDLGVATKFLCWLKIGRVPLLILIVIFMTVFVVCGYLIQYISMVLAGRLVPAFVAVPVALTVSIPALRICGGFLSNLIPRDETAAISQADLVGGRAVIILGSAKRGSAAQARLRDRFGTVHYVMVEPDDPEEELEQGSDLLLVNHVGSTYFAVRHPELPKNVM